MQLLEALPTPAFDLVNFDAYAKLCGRRKSGVARDQRRLPLRMQLLH